MNSNIIPSYSEKWREVLNTLGQSWTSKPGCLISVCILSSFQFLTSLSNDLLFKINILKSSIASFFYIHIQSSSESHWQYFQIYPESDHLLVTLPQPWSQPWSPLAWVLINNPLIDLPLSQQSRHGEADHLTRSAQSPPVAPHLTGSKRQHPHSDLQDLELSALLLPL